mmetsp:Transcript_65019/g.155420  ORF Transcript_65019/g.155420 Transcript_65019/m.155420 type:complete len:128 (+) Transcript_65019:2-385(+)
MEQRREEQDAQEIEDAKEDEETDGAAGNDRPASGNEKDGPASDGNTPGAGDQNEEKEAERRLEKRSPEDEVTDKEEEEAERRLEKFSADDAAVSDAADPSDNTEKADGELPSASGAMTRLGQLGGGQ